MMTEAQKEIRRERARRWNAEHPDEARRTKQLYYLKNRERLARQSAAYGKKNHAPNTKRLQAWREKHPWYDSWQGSRQRCTNPKNPSWHRYGGRGIKFLLSKADMQFLWARDGASGMKDPSIDRRDNDGDYSLDNCRFIERWENSKLGLIKRYYGTNLIDGL